MDLQQKIESRQAVISLIGLGYVGLPLAVAFAEEGFRVVGIDVDEDRVEAINRGESYVSDIPSAQVAALTKNNSSTEPGATPGNQPRSPIAQPAMTQRANRLSATTDFDTLSEADAVIICVPTPLDESKNPDMSHILAVTDEISQRLRRDMLIILESTTYPGTTEELVLPLLEECVFPSRKAGKDGQGPGANGNGHLNTTAEIGATSVFKQLRSSTASDSRPLEVGKDFFLAFSPERIDPGRTDYTIRTTPKVLGGVTPQCAEMAQALYSLIIGKVVLVSSPGVAEMVKLLENTFRAVNIALVNEMAIMCNRLGLDVWEVIEAASTKPFGFMPFYPGPGLGGHCIPIDPQYLAWKLRMLNYNARFIQLAAEVNFDMPHYVLGQIADALNEDGKALNGSTVLILGVAYKADIGDLRESPALDLIHQLLEKGATTIYHDPYVPTLDMDGLSMDSVPLRQDVLQSADCVVITTAHSSFDWQRIVQNSQLVVDTRNATKGVNTNPTRVVKL